MSLKVAFLVDAASRRVFQAQSFAVVLDNPNLVTSSWRNTYLGDSLVDLCSLHARGWSPEKTAAGLAAGQGWKAFPWAAAEIFTEPYKKPGRINCRQHSFVLKTEERQEEG